MSLISISVILHPYETGNPIQTDIIESFPSYCFHHFLMIFNKNTHTCERNTVEIDKREYLHFHCSFPL